MSKPILIIDDDRELTAETAEFLSDSGFSVEVAYDGESGIAMACRTAYAVILLDVKLPGLSGIEALRRIIDDNPSCKIILVSGNHDLEDLVDKNKLPVQVAGLLNKPFNAEKLITALNRIIA